MHIKHLVLATMLFACAPAAFGGIEELCFKNAGLKDEQTVLLDIDETRVTGTYKIMRDYSSDTVETFNFTGTRTGKTLKVKFKGNKLPSPNMKSLNWTLDDDGTKQTLRIKINGKNYDTNKFEDTLWDFEACEPSYAQLAKTAKRLSLDKAGQSKQTVKFTSKDERKAFLIVVPTGSALGVTAPMLSIQLYYPNEKKHDEPGTDSFSTDKLSRGGDCLIVLHRYSTPDDDSDEAGDYNVEFAVRSDN